MRETVYLRVSTFKKSCPRGATHFYGTIRDSQGTEMLTILQCATRARVIEVAKVELPRTYPGRKFKMIVRRETWDL